MRTAIGGWSIVSLCVVLGFAGGCGGPSAQYSVDTRDVTWSSGNPDVMLGGVNLGTVAVVTLKHDPAEIHRLVVWSDVSRNMTSSQSNHAGAGFRNTLITLDGRRIEVSAVIQRGQPGYVQIEDVRYELADGTIFLVSTVNNKVTVKQLQGGVEAFTSQPELKLPQVQELLKSRPEIREFFEAQHTEAAAN